MDRLPVVTWGLALCLLGPLGACKEQKAPAAVSRYEAVKAAPARTSRWCDSTFTGAGPRLTLPPLASPVAGHAQASLPVGKRAWVNLWATWCQPCLREMPLLLKWQGDLRKDGVDVDVLLLSLDEDAEALTTFLAGHREYASAKIARVASQSDYEQWVKGYVKDPATPIPIHLLGSPDGGLRCVRSGSLRESDYPAARSALR
jgi:thiol-disulfide isomerase/thioredoxin